LLGLLRLWADWAGILQLEMGTAILVLAIIIIFLALTWFIAVSLNKRDLINQESEQKFQKAFQASAAGISITRLSDSTYTEVNMLSAK